ncbi:hypothetical protein ACKWTF_016501 [Chironomus riparius]
MTFWDVGSSAPVQQFFNLYLKDKNALVFVVDASDKERIGNARWLLWQVMEDVQSLPLIVVGNKIDEVDAMDKNEIIEKLDLNQKPDCEYQFVMTSAKLNEGIDEALKCIYMCLYSRH